MIKTRRLVVMLAVLVGVLLPAFGTTASARENDAGPLYVHSKANNGQVFDDRNFAGTDLWTHQLNYGKNQQLILHVTAPGIVEISPESNPDESVTAIGSNAPLKLESTRGGDDAQAWQVHPLGPQDVVFESIAFRNEAITIVKNNGSAALRPYEGSAAQIWVLKLVQ